MGIGQEFIPEDETLACLGQGSYRKGEICVGVIPEEKDGGLEGAEEVARPGEEEVTCAGNACMASGAVMWSYVQSFLHASHGWGGPDCWSALFVCRTPSTNLPRRQCTPP